MTASDSTKDGMVIKPIPICILMIIYTGILFFSTTLVYSMMLVFSFILLIFIAKKRAVLFLMAYVFFMSAIHLMAKHCVISGWIGSLYTMGLIILKLFPLWILAAILSSFGTSTLIYSLRMLKIPNSLCIGIAIFFRFIPEYREYLLEIREGLKSRNMGFHLLRPIRSLEIYLVPLIYKAFETGEILACALLTKGIEYDCKKTSYADLSFTWRDGFVILVGILFAGITIWQKV